MANPLFDALFAPLQKRASAMLVLPDHSEITGRAFHNLIAQQANLLHALGVKPGDRIAAQITKTPQALALYGASVALGAVFLPLNPAYTDAEVAYFLNDATPKILVCDGARKDGLANCTPADCRVLTLNADGSGSLSHAASDAYTAVPRGPDDLAALLYTSGTTGRSKGAMLTQDNLLSNAQTLADLWQFTARDTLLHALPIFHTHGLFVATNTALLTGAQMIFLPTFHPDTVLAHLPRATTMMGVPTFYTRLLEDPRFTQAAAAHMRLFISGSAPLLADTHRAFAARTGQKILERYGMTETNMNTSNPYQGDRRAGTVGQPLPGVEVKITENGAELPQGQTGMIEVRGPNVFKGYWNMADKTAEDLRPDGFFITGDLGLLDPDGYLHIVGRQKDLIISGSAPLLADTHRAFAARTGQKILERYGMTETNMNTSNPYQGDRRAGTVGHPLPGVTVKITENGAELPQGQTGMIEVRGPNVIKGYWNMAEKTAEDLRPDGFFITGDLGMFDADGYLHIVGRQKDLIISGGFNIYPKEVELLLDAIPGVSESAVIGLPHPDFGEAVFAVLTATPSTTLDPDQVLKTLHAQLARFKHPKAAVVVKDLPRNAMGKVQKNVLRAEYGGWFGGGE